jgi:hypothetical protein
MLYREWKDFVTFSVDAGRIRSRVERLDTGLREGVATISLSTILTGEDVFECMEIEDDGYVMIWTRDKVWFLAREGNGGRIEKLRYVPRNPPTPKNAG